MSFSENIMFNLELNKRIIKIKFLPIPIDPRVTLCKWKTNEL